MICKGCTAASNFINIRVLLVEVVDLCLFESLRLVYFSTSKTTYIGEKEFVFGTQLNNLFVEFFIQPTIPLWPVLQNKRNLC
jgi:hypothetical protein